MFNSVRTVRVTTRDEFDRAFASADKLIVEGDDNLLSYAATRASQDPSQPPVRLDLSRSERRTIVTAQEAAPAARPVFANPLPPPPLAGPRPSGRRSAVPPLVVGFLAAAITACAVVAYLLLSSSHAPEAAPTSSALQPLPPHDDTLPRLFETLAWPAVAIVAIVALFLITRQAIAGGRNVEISWKVTEKIAGRLVITKVRSKTPARAA